MPIQSSIAITPISTEDFRLIDYKVMGQMYASQNELGRLADEQVYRADVAHRLTEMGLACEQEVPVTLSHSSFSKTLYLDLVVDQKAVYELKTVSALNFNHEAQLISYLYLLDLSRGKLVNFRSSTVESKYVNTPISREARRRFEVNSREYSGNMEFLQMVVNLVREWGTSLSLSLYHQALVHLLGGVDIVERMIPLDRNGHPLTNQRFHLVDSNSAFVLTAFSNPSHDYSAQIKPLLQLSPLHQVHWINFSVDELFFHTIKRT